MCPSNTFFTRLCWLLPSFNKPMFLKPPLYNIDTTGISMADRCWGTYCMIKNRQNTECVQNSVHKGNTLSGMVWLYFSPRQGGRAHQLVLQSGHYLPLYLPVGGRGWKTTLNAGTWAGGTPGLWATSSTPVTWWRTTTSLYSRISTRDKAALN